MTKSEYLLIATLAIIVGWLHPQAAYAQHNIEPEESPVRSECQASVSITPTNRVYATPTQADGKILLDGGEPTIMSVCKGHESTENSLQVHSMSRRIPLNVDHVSCKLRPPLMQKVMAYRKTEQEEGREKGDRRVK